jgi:predicted  nucleic acid-binding Zn-ribbon protein
MDQLEISIVNLQEELKTAHSDIVNLLKERNALKQTYSMQIDLVKALEEKINSLQTKLNPVE